MKNWRLWIDRGGTFIDIMGCNAAGREANATTLIEPAGEARVTATNGLVLDRREAVVARPDGTGAETVEPLLLGLSRNLFMSVAEQAGVVPQRAQPSVNIKEQVDFSCALFEALGRLIANAPHVPVHLGAIGGSVRHVIARRGGGLGRATAGFRRSRARLGRKIQGGPISRSSGLCALSGPVRTPMSSTSRPKSPPMLPPGGIRRAFFATGVGRACAPIWTIGAHAGRGCAPGLTGWRMAPSR